jgi:hypothetical protein
MSLILVTIFMPHNSSGLEIKIKLAAIFLIWEANNSPLEEKT